MDNLKVPAATVIAMSLLGGCSLDLFGGGNHNERPDAYSRIDAARWWPDAEDFSRFRVFVTAEAYGGNLAAFTGISDGLTAADNICATRASNAGMPGYWMAWLSTSTVNAIDRIASGPLYLPDRSTVVFPSWDSLRTEPLVPINTNEWGQPAAFDFWTGTLYGGQRSGTSPDGFCGDWAGNSARALTGSVWAVDARWTEDTMSACNVPHALLCIEQWNFL